jgi:hypothetical protein
MPKHDISISMLKTRQDEYETRKDKLLQSFIPFRDSLLERLEQFTKEAIENGLRGVNPCKRKKGADETLEVDFRLNDFDLVLIYSEGSDDNTPRVEIVFQESIGKSYNYYMRWFTTNGPRFITGVHAINEKAGQEAAEALIGHFYRFKRVWKEKPTLGVMRKRKSENRTIGFLAPE